MLMFDPQYIRPDDVGTHRNKALLISDTDTIQAVEPITHRPADKAKSKAVPAVTTERRKQRSLDRRHNDRRQHELVCLLDTRSNRERRSQLRRHKDISQLEPDRTQNPLRLGINETT